MGLDLVNKNNRFFTAKTLKRKFTAREIANWIFKTYPKACYKKTVPLYRNSHTT